MAFYEHFLLFWGVLLAVRGCICALRGCSRTLKIPNSPPPPGPTACYYTECRIAALYQPTNQWGTTTATSVTYIISDPGGARIVGIPYPRCVLRWGSVVSARASDRQCRRPRVMRRRGPVEDGSPLAYYRMWEGGAWARQLPWRAWCLSLGEN